MGKRLGQILIGSVIVVLIAAVIFWIQRPVVYEPGGGAVLGRPITMNEEDFNSWASRRLLFEKRLEGDHDSKSIIEMIANRISEGAQVILQDNGLAGFSWEIIWEMEDDPALAGIFYWDEENWNVRDFGVAQLESGIVLHELELEQFLMWARNQKYRQSYISLAEEYRHENGLTFLVDGDPASSRLWGISLSPNYRALDYEGFVEWYDQHVKFFNGSENLPNWSQAEFERHLQHLTENQESIIVIADLGADSFVRAYFNQEFFENEVISHRVREPKAVVNDLLTQEPEEQNLERQDFIEQFLKPAEPYLIFIERGSHRVIHNLHLMP